jgi:hypothetical protein
MLIVQKKLSRFVRCFLLAMVLTATIVVVWRVNATQSQSYVSTTTTGTPPVRGPVQVVRFTLYDLGIYPQETRVKPGMVTIALEDLSGASSGLIIERIEASSRVPSGLVSKASNRLRSRTEFFLPQGRYEVADATRPDSRVLLIVEP